MPESVEIPAPVNAVTRCASTSHAPTSAVVTTTPALLPLLAKLADALG